MFPTRYIHFLLFLIWFLAIPLSMEGQGKIVLHEPQAVTTMMQQFVINGKSNETIKAWRIQILTTDDRREMEAARAQFITLYPDVSLDWKHVVPYYQVRVGAFDNKNSMMPFLLELKKYFPAATPVYDNINKRTLVYK